MTRITSEMMVTGSLRRLSTRLEQYERTQTRMATGKRILAPSDSPGDANRMLGLRAVARAREQESRNAADAKSWLDTADSQLQAAMERLGRARDLSIGAANPRSEGEQLAVASELRGIRDEIIGIANYRSRGRPLFSGFADADAVQRTATGYAYGGDGGEITRRVSESDVVVSNINAMDAFGFPDPADPSTAANVDVFTVLDQLITDVEAGNNAAVAATIGKIDTARVRIGDSLARVGAAANTVESALGRTHDSLLAIRGELAQVEDVDMAEAVMELQMQEAAYQATLQALARALPPSLVAFLR